MNACPACGEPDGQFVRTKIDKISASSCLQTDTYYCTRCEYEWEAEHSPADSFHPFSAPDFELTVSSVVGHDSSLP